MSAPDPSSPTIAHAEALCASYGEGALRVPVLESATFAVARGRITAITGPSGSGKTTVLSLLGALDRPESGRLVVDGVDLTTLGARALTRFRRERVGFVFQAFQLLPALTIAENVEAGLEPLGLGRRIVKARAAEALEAVGLRDLGARFPYQLSGGQQQRVAVARAWAKRPALLLADEPTGNLDDDASEQVLDLLLGAAGAGAEARYASTVVVVTHDPNVAARADEVLVVHGHKVEARTPA